MTKIAVVVFSAAAVLLLLSTTATKTRTTGLVEAFFVAPQSSHRSSRHFWSGNRNGLSLPVQSMPVLVATTTTTSSKCHRLQATTTTSTGEVRDDDSGDNNNRPKKIRNVVIAGGGIIGTSVAYYLVEDHFRTSSSRQEDFSVTIVDPTGTVGSCASGKAGGFLARDWRDGSPLQEMQRTGFDLHQELANVFASTDGSSSNNDDETDTETDTHPTDYRRLTCAAVAVDESEEDDDDDTADGTTTTTKRVPNKPPSKKLIDLEWVDPDVVLWGETDDDETNDDPTGGGAVYPMGDETTIAQVHPRKLCQALWNAISSTSTSNTQEKPHTGTVELVQGRIVKAMTEDDTTNGSRVMTGIELEDGRILPSDVLVIACGPWTYEANRWFNTDDANNFILPVISAVKCHSILVPSATGRPNTQAVFFDSNGAIGDDGDLEVYPRPDGDSYVNGFAGEETVCSERPGEEIVETDKIELLRSAMEFVEKYDNNDNNNNNTSIADEPFERPAPRDHTQQVCYWPETPDGLPIIGEIPAIDGAYVAAGHSVWGILQGPATGKALAELIVNGKSETVDLAPFSLERYENQI